MCAYSLTEVKYTDTHTTFGQMSAINRSCLDVREQETTHTRVVFPSHLHIKTKVYFYFDEAVTFFLTLPLVVSSQADSKNGSGFKGFIHIRIRNDTGQGQFQMCNTYFITHFIFNTVQLLFESCAIQFFCTIIFRILNFLLIYIHFNIYYYTPCVNYCGCKNMQLSLSLYLESVYSLYNYNYFIHI